MSHRLEKPLSPRTRNTTLISAVDQARREPASLRQLDHHQRDGKCVMANSIIPGAVLLGLCGVVAGAAVGPWLSPTATLIMGGVAGSALGCWAYRGSIEPCEAIDREPCEAIDVEADNKALAPEQGRCKASSQVARNNVPLCIVGNGHGLGGDRSVRSGGDFLPQPRALRLADLSGPPSDRPPPRPSSPTPS
jgi:hypothetical protein